MYFLVRIPEREVEDLIQEVFLRMVEALPRFEQRCSVRTFLVTIARNVMRETLRELHRPDGRFDPFEESLFALSGRSITSVHAGEQVQQLLLDALQHVTSEEHDLIELYYFHELTHQEIADVLGIPLGTTKSRMAAARRDLLREFMTLLGADAEGWTEDALDRGLTAAREIVLRGKRREPGTE